MKKYIVFLLIIFIASCGNHHYKNKIYGSGTIEATEVNVSSKVVGRISYLTVDEDDRVIEGQLIAKLDDLDQAEKDFHRAETLYQRDMISAEQFEKARQYKNNFIISAPINGIVIIKELDQGEIVTPGTPIVTLADIENLWIKIYIPEKEIGKVKIGAKADILVDAFPRHVFQGEVSYISQIAEFIPKNIQTKEERINQVFAIKVSVKNKDYKLKIGMPADVYIME